ncbi:MAG: L,D-transpeptidase family protein [Candidatus Omnitrophica bacterium]|nr:L,D-transpeptidase family protein [Candidatus Omnitrophota bacterium]
MKARVIYTLIFFLSLGFLSCKPAEKEKPEKEQPSLEKKIEEAQQKEKEDALLQARKLYKEVFSQLTQPSLIEEVRRKIESLNIKILFSKIIDEDSFLYEVKPGDTLEKIAKRFGTTVELLKKANNLSSDIIRVGDKLKVTKAKFSIVVDKSQNRLFLKKGNEIFKTYIVSTGKNNSTPAGTFKIVTKLKNPVWFRKDIGAVVPPDSPENVLGSRWLGLNIEGYGIHGTNKPNKLGEQNTQGCIRMSNKDVEELFSIVPRGIEVTIVD